MGSVCCSCNAATPTSRQVATMIGDLDIPVGTPRRPTAVVSAKGVGTPVFSDAMAAQSRSHHTIPSFGRSCNDEAVAATTSPSQPFIGPKNLNNSDIKSKGFQESRLSVAISTSGPSALQRQCSNSTSTTSNSTAAANANNNNNSSSNNMLLGVGLAGRSMAIEVSPSPHANRQTARQASQSNRNPSIGRSMSHSHSDHIRNNSQVRNPMEATTPSQLAGSTAPRGSSPRVTLSPLVSRQPTATRQLIPQSPVLQQGALGYRM